MVCPLDVVPFWLGVDESVVELLSVVVVSGSALVDESVSLYISCPEVSLDVVLVEVVRGVSVLDCVLLVVLFCGLLLVLELELELVSPPSAATMLSYNEDPVLEVDGLSGLNCGEFDVVLELVVELDPPLLFEFRVSAIAVKFGHCLFTCFG